MKKLSLYNKKRDFRKTLEPEGIIKKTGKRLSFCVQHHLARRDHFDLRLEKDGVLVSWAVPKGPSYNPSDKRLAIKVEDHPISYKNYEGIIPEGSYGAGEVMLFDKGYYEVIEWNKNIIKVILKGMRLKGMWTLSKMSDNNWLLIKDKDYYTNYIDINIYKRSIKSNRTFSEIKNKDKVKKIEVTNKNKKIIGNISKEDIFSYYKLVCDKMMPYVENRIISTICSPSGINKEIFFKKHFLNKEGYLKKVNKEYYSIIDGLGLLNEVNMNNYEFHINTSNAYNKLANIMVFDFDPSEELDLKVLRDGVKKLKVLLDKLKLKSYLKTSGGKGYHVFVPISFKISKKKLFKISKDIAITLEEMYPSVFTTNMSKKERKGKIFIDYYRNQDNASVVAPYSIRLRKKATISMPISWKNLDKIKPDGINIKNVNDMLKKKDPWNDFFH